jgi:hypothetical protein
MAGAMIWVGVGRMGARNKKSNFKSKRELRKIRGEFQPLFYEEKEIAPGVKN